MIDLLSLASNWKKSHAKIGRILLFGRKPHCSEQLLLLPQGRSQCRSALELILGYSCLLGIVMTLEIQSGLAVLPALTDLCITGG